MEDKNELIKFLNNSKIQNLINNGDKKSLEDLYIMLEDYDGQAIPGDFGNLSIQIGMNIPKILGYIPRRFLQYQSDIIQYTIPENCKYISMSAFEDTSISQIEIPEGVKDIDYLAFAGTELELIYLPKSVLTIENAAFHSCKKLKMADLRHVEFMGEDVFGDCINLIQIILSNKLEQLCANIFDGCNRLKKINFLGTCDEFKKIIDGDPEFTLKVFCNNGVFIWEKGD